MELLDRVEARNEPTMNTSPWAKLMSRTIPYTIVYPRAIRRTRIPAEAVQRLLEEVLYGFTIMTNFCWPPSI